MQICALGQQSPTSFGIRDWFCGRQFLHRRGGQWFKDDSSTLHLLCTLFLLLLQKFHLRSSGIRSCRLGTSVLCHLPELLMGLLFSNSRGSLPGNAPSLAAFLSLTQLPAPLRSLLLQNKLTALEYLSKGLLTVKFKSEEVPRIILNWEGYYISLSYPPALPSLLP